MTVFYNSIVLTQGNYDAPEKEIPSNIPSTESL